MRQEKGRSPGNKLVILEGKMYGPQQVVREVFGKRDSKGDPIRAFECKCIHCGTTKTFLLNNLETRNTKSCKCLRGEPGNKSKVSIGDMFGPVSIIKELEKRAFDGQSQRQFLGKCECGDIRSYLLSNLKKLKKHKSCFHLRKAWNKGMKTGKPSWNKRDMSLGQRVSLGTVISEFIQNGKRWVAIRCGKDVLHRMTVTNLRKKLKRNSGCGCIAKEAWNKEDMSPGKRMGPGTVIAEFVQNNERWVEILCGYGKNHKMTVRNLRKKHKRNRDCACAAKRRGEWHHRRKPFTNTLNRALRNVLKGGVSSKTGRETFELLGYTKQAAFERLNPFLGEQCEECKSVILNLENSQIDHIKPLCKAKTEAEVIELYRLINLRMICKNCNHKKGPKFNDCSAQNNQKVIVDTAKVIA